MRRDLFFIPDHLGKLPVFGPLGWLALAWVLFSIGLMVWLVRRHGWSTETKSYLPVIAIVWLVVAFVAPMIVVAGQGIPIRGYGVMLLLGVVAGVVLAAFQAHRLSVDPEIIYSLAFTLFITAIVGARIFYVIQYWEQFQSDTLAKTIGNIANVTEGGLVVYGSLIGGLAGAIWFLRRHELPVLAIADLIAPAMLVGLSLGRIGCLLNGCCYGGICDNAWVGPIPVVPLTFPAGPPESPPYQDQRLQGLLHGVEVGMTETGRPMVIAIDADGPAAASKLLKGDIILQINGRRVVSPEESKAMLRTAQGTIEIKTAGGKTAIWSLPPRSLPVVPAQIYSSINAALLALLLWMAYPFRPRDGFVMALLLTLYPITRFLLEGIRSDEPGRWGTGLTISQLISLGFVLLSVGLWVYIIRKPPTLALPPKQMLRLKNQAGATN